LEYPANGFASAYELRQWTETSSFGGGSVESFSLGDRMVYVATRCFTPGRPTSELSIYTDKTDGKGVYRLLFQPTRTVELRTRFDDDGIIVEQYDQQSSKWIVCLTITKYFFESQF
jgi:hypothetical protein